jgi:hypothetical protein
MVDFRKFFLLLALVAVTAGLASAQVNVTPLSCVANAAVPPLVRAEGIAEEVGQVTIDCRGGQPVAAGQPIPLINVQIFLDVNLTSRLMAEPASSNPAGLGIPSEALLLIDEPNTNPGGTPNPLLVCPGSQTFPQSVCNMNAADSTGSILTYDGSATGRFNTWHAQNAGPNTVAWLGIPFNPPGTQQNRVIRLVNVRANATERALSLVPQAIQMRISISGTGSLSLSNPIQTVAFVQQGLFVTASPVDFKQCRRSVDYTVRFREGFANVMRLRGTTSQNIPGTIYNTESMFTSFAQGLPERAGYATQATRVQVAFRDIPANISISAPGVLISDRGEPMWLRNAANDGFATAGRTILASDATTRTGTAIYEIVPVDGSNVINTSAISQWTAVFTIAAATTPTPNPPLPALGSGSVAVSFSPLSTVFTQSWPAPAPRFLDRSETLTAFTVTPCRTNLLWPYVTTFTGFETGLAISNTSRDPYGTPTQRGACLISYYGAAPAGATLPNRTSTGIVEPGRTIAWTVSTGAGDVPGVTNFTGYVIAECNFQFAHGYGFITNLGETRWAQGYLALVLDADMFDPLAGLTRTGDTSETLKH